MADWAPISSRATAGGTMILAVATFSSVRSANRAARTAARALQVGLRPVPMPSRLEDPPEKMMWGDGRWATVRGGRGFVAKPTATSTSPCRCAMSVPIAGLQSWHPDAGLHRGDPHYPDRDQFHRQGRDRSVPPGGTSFWQGALRDQDDETYRTIHDAIVSGDSVTIHLLYSDHEGGQRAVTRFSLTRCDDSEWISSVIRHWNLDRDEPR